MTQSTDEHNAHGQRVAAAIDKFEELVLRTGAARAFLIGAGCSKCAGLPLTMELTSIVLDSERLEEVTKDILLSVRDSFAGGDGAHIEDYLSEIIDLLAIAERRFERGVPDPNVLVGDGTYTVEQMRTAVEGIKREIAETIGQRLDVSTHRKFVAALHRPVRGDLTSAQEQVDYLVLNYDTAIEDALGLQRIPYADGIDGGATGSWNPQTFERQGLAARVFKLHGSIDWYEIEGEDLPFRVGPNVDAPGPNERNIVIWPASTKYKETQLDPYAQLAIKARQTLGPRSGYQTVLVICGYSFGDQHINEEIDTALKHSDGNLTVVAFSGENSLAGQLREWHEDPAVSDQLLIFAKNGFFHGSDGFETDKCLSWWRFEEIARLLGGER